MSKEPTIFVSVASYRDPETFMTVTDLLAKARYPERIYIGVLSQINRKTEFKHLAPFGPRIRQEVVDYKDSQGVCWARSRILTKLREDEEYVLQIDSHSRFKPNWDTTLLDMYRALGTKKAVITYYPPNYTPGETLNYRENHFFFFLVKELSDPGIPKFSSGVLNQADRPIQECGTIGLAGGSLFGHRSVFDTVPYDPRLYFFGEEPSYALRLYTHGIDCYSPTESYMYHYYNITEFTKVKVRSMHWEDHGSAYQRYNAIAHDRLRYLFNLQPRAAASSLVEMDRYGLGQERTLLQWQSKFGLDLSRGFISESAKNRIYY